jgi:hypothetical protein
VFSFVSTVFSFVNTVFTFVSTVFPSSVCVYLRRYYVFHRAFKLSDCFERSLNSFIFLPVRLSLLALFRRSENQESLITLEQSHSLKGV